MSTTGNTMKIDSQTALSIPSLFTFELSTTVNGTYTEDCAAVESAVTTADMVLPADAADAGQPTPPAQPTKPSKPQEASAVKVPPSR